MTTKKKPDGGITNTNNNTNHVTVNVEYPKEQSTPPQSNAKKTDEPNWYVRTILGGIIALLLSIGGYYLQKAIDGKGSGKSPDLPIENQIKANPKD